VGKPNAAEQGLADRRRGALPLRPGDVDEGLAGLGRAERFKKHAELIEVVLRIRVATGGGVLFEVEELVEEDHGGG
jgi:hypothetical protein